MPSKRRKTQHKKNEPRRSKKRKLSNENNDTSPNKRRKTQHKKNEPKTLKKKKKISNKKINTSEKKKKKSYKRKRRNTDKDEDHYSTTGYSKKTYRNKYGRVATRLFLNEDNIKRQN